MGARLKVRMLQLSFGDVHLLEAATREYLRIYEDSPTSGERQRARTLLANVMLLDARGRTREANFRLYLDIKEMETVNEVTASAAKSELIGQLDRDTYRRLRDRSARLYRKLQADHAA